MMSPEVVQKVQEWRQRIRDTGTLPPEEMKEAIKILRADRVRASATSTKAKTTKAAKVKDKNVDSDGLLDELEGL